MRSGRDTGGSLLLKAAEVGRKKLTGEARSPTAGAKTMVFWLHFRCPFA